MKLADGTKWNDMFISPVIVLKDSEGQWHVLLFYYFELCMCKKVPFVGSVSHAQSLDMIGLPICFFDFLAPWSSQLRLAVSFYVLIISFASDEICSLFLCTDSHLRKMPFGQETWNQIETCSAVRPTSRFKESVSENGGLRMHYIMD